MSTSNGAIVNPYQRILLRRGVSSDASAAGAGITEPKGGDPDADSGTEGGEDNTEIINNTDNAGYTYKDGLTEEEKIEVDNTLNNLNTSLSGFKLEEKTPGIIKGLSERARNILNEIFSKSNGNLTITSGLRSEEENTKIGGNPNSFHLKGDAIDLRPNATVDAFLTSAEGLKWLDSMGYEAVDERLAGGTGAHWHLEPKPVKMLRGGLLYKRK